MLGKIGAYVITLIIFACIELPFIPITLSLGLALKKVKWIALSVTCLLDAVKVGAAVLLASWLIQKGGDQSPSWLMFLIPGFLMVKNDQMRIGRVKEGRSNVKRILEQNGEPELYDQKYDLWVEQLHLIGDIAGWIVGTNIVLQSSNFF